MSDRELINYYKYALCFVYPSLYEGFGIPPLETMVSQCPVIASDINVFHEIYNKAVLYVNPTDEEQISDVIRLLINDEKLQKKISGFRRKTVTIIFMEKKCIESY